MRKWGDSTSQRWRVVALVGCLLAVVGCSRFDSHASTSFSPVSIERLQDVHGRWEGPVKALESRDTGWVSVNVTNREAFATYTFAGMGKGNPFLGTGRLLLQDGRLLTEGEGRALTFTLAKREGIRMLIVDGTGKDGKSYHAELSRAE